MPAVQSLWWCFTIFFTIASPPRPGSSLREHQCVLRLLAGRGVSHDSSSPFAGLSAVEDCVSFCGEVLVRGSESPSCETASSSDGRSSRLLLKEETRVSGPFEFGDYCPSGSHKRRQRESVIRSPVRMAEENPVRLPASKGKDCRGRIPEDRGMRIQISNLKSWQSRLQTLLERAPDDRTIFWVYGPDGGEGKSTFARDLYRSGTWFYTRGGSADNVSYQYIGQLGNNIVFDIPRDKKDYLQYSLIEMFKDRLIVSNKYEPLMGPFINCIHVVVMSNFLPDFEKISMDRVHVIPCRPCGVCLKHHNINDNCEDYID
uniref:Replication protein n=1 Tax=Gossypium darwinii symptomless alphasatellite TaxID=656025 RepID=B9TVN6_9VIRU|nr:replication protein [Gossypium darwinii symptomless alphasatellite]